MLDVENIRLHYAQTLEWWLQRYEENVEAMYARCSTRRSCALWRLYLVGSIAAFRSGDLQLFQVVFSRAGTNDIPWTRAHVYRAQVLRGLRGRIAP